MAKNTNEHYGKNPLFLWASRQKCTHIGISYKIRTANAQNRITSAAAVDLAGLLPFFTSLIWCFFSILHSGLAGRVLRFPRLGSAGSAAQLGLICLLS
jgi:hypothetical protein